MQSFYEGKSNLKTTTRRFNIENLPEGVLENVVRFHFTRFGEIESLKITNSELTKLSSATIEYVECPLASILKQEIYISNRNISVLPEIDSSSDSYKSNNSSNTEVSPFPNLEEHFNMTTSKSRLEVRNENFELDWLELGMYYEKTFYSEWTSNFIPKEKLLCRFIIDQPKAMLAIYFTSDKYIFRANIFFHNIHNSIILEEMEATNQIVLTINNKIPPKLWFTDKQKYIDAKNIGGTFTWLRLADHLSEDFLYKGDFSNPVTPPYKNMKRFNLGVHLAWRVAIGFTGYADKLRQLRRLGVLSEFNVLKETFDAATVKRRVIEKKEPVYFPRDLAFSVQYSLESLFSLNLTVYHAQSQKFTDLLRSQPAYKITRVVERIWAEDVKILDLYDYFTKELESPVYLQHNLRTPTYNALIRKVIVTPTKMVFLPPIFEVTNRILRKFHKFEDRFLRVTFADENLMQLSSSTEENQYLYKRIFYALFYGISFAGRNYKFLAFSSSQLREHGCWFFADGPDLKVGDIHQFMGKFDKINNVAKYAARMGQSFSSSRDGTKLDGTAFIVIPDVIRNGFTFSDGVGKISSYLLRKIAKKLNMDVVPSAIQFRMGGFKGVLAKCPDLPDNMVHFRESQRKFDSDHFTLEVIRRAAFSTSHLNRQLIVILSTLGVPDKTFIQLQDEMVADLCNVTTDLHQARRCLVKYFDGFGVSARLLRLANAGFLETSDSYLKNCLQLVCANIKTELKQKARIHVTNGALLIGVMDETETLEAGQIFVCCTDPMSPNLTERIITGTCIVTRNPAFHPGDIQKVQAVDSPNLHHLKNVVVFSSKGERDLPSMFSGGDLDGDEFTVIWDRKLLPPQSNAPMAPLPAKPKHVNPVQISHVVAFFVEYIVSDNLGQIANAHLAHSDLSAKGVHDPKCLVLAQKHSRAVDFPKSGIPATFPKELRAEMFPDFMEKVDKQCYTSQKVLGKLYRKVGTMEFREEPNPRCDQKLLVEGYEAYVDSAVQAKLDYDAAIRSVMNQFGVKSEFEAVCGCILHHHGMVKKSSYRVREMVLDTIHSIQRDFSDRFYSEFRTGKQEFAVEGDNPTEILKKVSAWYYVSYDPVIQVDTGSTLTTFVWCIPERMVQLIQAVSKPKLEEVPQPILFQPDGLDTPNGNLSTDVELVTYPTTGSNLSSKPLAHHDTIQQILHMGSDTLDEEEGEDLFEDGFLGDELDTIGHSLQVRKV